MTAQSASGLRIVEIHNQRVGSRDADSEYVRVDNDGTYRWAIAGWLLTDETSQQVRPHVFRFPQLIAGRTWTLDPGETVVVVTGTGTDTYVNVDRSKRPTFWVYWGRTAFVWNNSGDIVYLRHPDGEFVTQPFPCP